MKKTILTIIFSVAVISAFAQEVRLSLDDCIVMSESNDPYIKNTKLDIYAAQAQKREVHAEYFPRLSFSATGIWSQHHFIDLLVDPEIGDMIQDMGGGMARNGLHAGFALMQPVYAGGRIVTGNKLAKLGVRAAELKHKVNIREKREEVESSYWEIVALEEKGKTLNHLDELLNVLHKDVSSGIEAGVITGSDLLLVNMKKNELKSGKIQLEGGIKLLKMNLFNAIGQPYSFIKEISDEDNPHIDQIILSDRLSSLLPPSDHYIPEEDMAADVTEAELLELLVESKKLEKRLEMGKYLPSVGIGGTYGSSKFVRSTFNGFLLARVTIPISEWGKGSHKLKRLDYQVQKAQNEKDYLTSQLILQARQLWLNLNVAWDQMKVAEENVALAEKTVYDQMSQYNAGLIPLSDLLMSQTKLFEATENHINKQIEYRKALTAYNGRKKN